MYNQVMPTVLSLFSGAGGMDLGLEGDFNVLKRSVNQELHPDWIIQDNGDGWVKLAPTGFKTIFANDNVEEAKLQWMGFLGKRIGLDVYSLGSIVDLVKSYKEKEFVFPYADVVTGGFPCTDFSLSGKRSGFKSKISHNGSKMEEDSPEIESRGMLYHWMKEVVSAVQPKVFIAENVDGLKSLPKVRLSIESDFSGVGYNIRTFALYAPDYGVPQTRMRIFFVGFRKDLVFKDWPRIPKPTHSPLKEGEETLFDGICNNPYVTCRNAFIGLKEPEESEDASQNALSGAKYYGRAKNGNPMQGQNEVCLDEPGPTIRAEHHGNIEFRRLSLEHNGKNIDELKAGMKERRLTVRECARLQTFPDDYEFILPGISVTKGYRGVGNAVPPLLAYHLASWLKSIWPNEV